MLSCVLGGSEILNHLISGFLEGAEILNPVFSSGIRNSESSPVFLGDQKS